MNPTIFNSKSKIGVILFALVVLAQLWLPTLGINLTGEDWEKIFRSIEVIAIIVATFGIRDAIFKTQNEFYQTKWEEEK